VLLGPRWKVGSQSRLYIPYTGSTAHQEINMKYNKGNTLGVVLLVLGGLFLLWLIIIVPFFGFHKNTGNGTHVGFVTAVEKSGVFFKTGTAYIKSDISSSQEDSYCVVDDKVLEDLRALSLKKSKVEVTYFEWFSAGIANCAGEGAIISGVKEIE